MNSISITVRGISPLLMHAYPMVPVEGLDKLTPEEQARVALYQRPDGGAPYVPGVNFQRGIVAAAAFSKGKGRASLAKIAAAAFFVTTVYLDISPPSWVVDSRPVVIPSTKGRIVRHRPRFDAWEISATLEYDERLLSETQLRRCIDDFGQRVGLLDFRP
jgi:hypothetical protein